MPRRPPGLKAKLWAQATGHLKVPCHWCRHRFTFEELTADHEPPLALNGSPNGAVLACEPCNSARGRETNDRVNELRKRKGGKHRKRRKKR